MKFRTKYIILALAFISSAKICAQEQKNDKFAINVGAEIGLGNCLSTTSDITSMANKATSNNYEIVFGWTFWQKRSNSLEINVGVAYSPMSVDLDLTKIDYNYSASASADLDGDEHLRYYELNNILQKVSYDSFTVPIYLSYAYKCNKWLRIHADFGVRMRFKASSKLSSVSGDSYSYGIYPQYDNLVINDSYINDFGITNLADSKHIEPKCAGFSSSLMVGIGAEFRIYKHLAADLSLRYNAGFTNLFTAKYTHSNFTEDSAPISYTVAEGQRVNSLTDYLYKSKIQQPTLRVGLIYRF